MRPIAVCLAFLLAAITVTARAEGDKKTPVWKLTLGDYFYSGFSGIDVNLRWREHDTSAWIGAYRDKEFGSQARAGFDTAFDVVEHVQLQPSLQIASRSFLGGSLNLQVGDQWYGIAGIGRTNLQPYFNLNFDPNDAVTIGAGHRTESGRIFTLFVVADDRLHTGQRDWHFNARIPVGESRATLDLLRKSGMSDAGPIVAWGFSGTWDWPSVFVRLAYDPKQNFSAFDAWRVAGGIRF